MMQLCNKRFSVPQIQTSKVLELMAPSHLWPPWISPSMLQSKLFLEFHPLGGNQENNLVTLQCTFKTWVPADNRLKKRPKGGEESIHPLGRLSLSSLTNLHCLKDQQGLDLIKIYNFALHKFYLANKGSKFPRKAFWAMPKGKNLNEFFP